MSEAKNLYADPADVQEVQLAGVRKDMDYAATPEAVKHLRQLLRRDPPPTPTTPPDWTKVRAVVRPPAGDSFPDTGGAKERLAIAVSRWIAGDNPVLILPDGWTVELLHPGPFVYECGLDGWRTRIEAPTAAGLAEARAALERPADRLAGDPTLAGDFDMDDINPQAADEPDEPVTLTPRNS